MSLTTVFVASQLLCHLMNSDNLHLVEAIPQQSETSGHVN